MVTVMARVLQMGREEHHVVVGLQRQQHELDGLGQRQPLDTLGARRFWTGVLAQCATQQCRARPQA